MDPEAFPEKRAAERWIALALFVSSCLYLTLFLRFTYMDPDEGITLQGAQRIVQGQVLYRDFFEFLTPGSYYFLALLFRLFGSSMMVARAVLAVYGGLFSVFTYWIARRTCSLWCALATAYLVLITCLPWRFVALHNWDSTLWTCLAVYCAVWFVQQPNWIWAFGMGTCTSITFLFEQSKGAGLLLGLIGALIYVGWRVDPSSRLPFAHWMVLIAGVLWPLICTLSYFATKHAIRDLLVAWTWPLEHYTVVNRVPYGYQDWSDAARESMFSTGPWLQRCVALLTVSPCFLLPALPIIALVLLIHWLVPAEGPEVSRNRRAIHVVICSSVVGLLLSVLVVRTNITHFAYLDPVTYLMLGWIVDARDIRSNLLRTIRPVLLSMILLTFSMLGLTLLIANRNAQHTLVTRRGVLRVPGNDEVVQYLQSYFTPGSKIVVYPYLPLFYYLSATTAVSRFDYLQPGMHTAEQQQEALRDIAADPAAPVAFEPAFADRIPTSWPNTPLRFLAEDPIADYLLAHYHSCRQLRSATERRFLLMMRNGINCPS